MENIENIEKKDNSETSSDYSHLSVLTTSVGSEEIICNYNHFINDIKNCDNMIYPINYGYVEGVISDDGQEQDVYVLGTDEPIETFEGRVIAIYHRFNDAEDKWIVSFSGSDYSNKEILQAIHFQEKYFEGELVR